jgi:hypothetical protein
MAGIIQTANQTIINDRNEVMFSKMELCSGSKIIFQELIIPRTFCHEAPFELVKVRSLGREASWLWLSNGSINTDGYQISDGSHLSARRY